MVKVAVGNDHGGVNLKKAIVKHLENQGVEVINVGTDTNDSVDFPDFATKVCEKVNGEIVDLGILICGTGIGMSIAANKVKGIRAAVVGDVFSAKATREHNNTNVLCLGERVTGEGLALMIVDTWLQAEFEGDRHIKRIQKITDIENS